MTTTGLQCPTCGHVHPLADVPGEGRFRCAGCSRLLSVPASLEAPAPAARPSDGDATQAHPAPTPRRPAAAGTPGPVLPGAPEPPPAWVRVPVWVLALGLGFVVSAAVLRAVGLLDVDAVLDAFAGEGVGRYGVLLVLLPLWAVLSAGAAHLVLEWVGRRRERRRTPRGRGDAGKSEKAQSRKDERARRAV
ncbi:MAG: hypothetical protein ACRD0S_11070 [Acidimicrobiales bacterium]